ncbi:MAG: diaminopimelate decarboxylase [Pseudomonadota bacterium]|nr:diaminopimelate decarboxylase [Pseudomonadota bacterium]
MKHFEYRGGNLFAEDVSIAEVATNVGTPFYCYSASTIEQNYEIFSRAIAPLKGHIFYALKANSNQAVIKTLANLGAGADVVSEGETRRALAAGIPGPKIIFSGVGKTRSEIKFALSEGIGQFNVESENELKFLDEISREIQRTATIAIRINPDVEAKTHNKISTGRKEDKFGISIDQAKSLFVQAAKLELIKPIGFSVHIGSQLTTLKPFREAFSRVAEVVRLMRKEGFVVSRLDLGGGLGIKYQQEQPPNPKEYASVVSQTLGGLNLELAFEPGRFLVGDAGVLVTSVLQEKLTSTKRFVIVDTAMNDLIRPTLYQAFHNVIPVKNNKRYSMGPAEIVGPVCETGDLLASNITLPKLSEGDLLVIETTGAYGAVMASTYNSRLLVPEILVNRNKHCIIRPRPSYEMLMALDCMPDWL